uniref:hypothetical protein n=1 Tax=Scandinavium goeteborgense TaxID=1851514 RepID=UPI00135B07B2|nr:hypothetical protein [Scandinavium goeteborgense]
MIKVTRTFNYEANDNEILQLLRLARSVWNRNTLLKAGKAEMRIFHAHTLLLNPTINEARTCEAFRKAIHEAVEMLRRDAKDAIEADHAEALTMNGEYQNRTGHGVSHNTKAYSAPLSLLGNGLLDGGVRFHVVPLLCVVLAVPGLKRLI